MTPPSDAVHSERSAAPVSPAAPPRLPRSRIGWLVVLVVHAALLWVYYLPSVKTPLGDERMYRRAAEAVLADGTSAMGTFWPPFYAWFLAPLLAAAGGGVWLVQAVQTGLLCVAAWLLRRLLLRGLEDEWAADAAFFVVLAYPSLAAFAHYLWPELLHLTLMLGALTLLVESRGRPVPVVAAGGLLALCLQTKVLLLPLLPVVVVGLLIAWPARRRWRAAACLVLALAAGVAPTLHARHRDFGRVMLADSGWFNAWVGLNEVAHDEFEDRVLAEEYARYRQSARSAARRAAIAREKLGTLLRERGLVSTARRQLLRQYFRLFHRESFLTQQLPGGAVHERGDGYRSTARLPAAVLRSVSFAAWTALLVGFAVGVAIFPYRRRPIGWWVLGYFGAYCALFLVLHVKTRYRIQLLPAMIFFALYAVTWWRARRQGTAEARHPARWAAGSALALALLYLAHAAD